MLTFTMSTNETIGFDQARELAIGEAKKHLIDPFNLSWANQRTGQHFPAVERSQAEGKEMWEVYGESQGGTVRVEVGDQYVFIFKDGFDFR